MDELRIDKLTQVLKEVIAFGGQSETSRIAPNLEVIDATPPVTTVPAGYIIIENEQGFYIPALEVPGVSYANGDLVNVLFIKGTEPIAMQQGSSSPSSNLWEIVPATTTDIFYDQGNVGINNPIPAENLDVLGSVVVDTNVFYIDDANDFVGFGVVVSNTSQQVYFLMDDSKDILIDGTTNPRQIDTGVMRFEQTPAIPDTRCITYNVNANSQPNTHAVVVNLTATAVAVGETISAYDIVVNSANSTGGHVHGFEMSLAGAGAIEAHALHANPGIDPIHHLSGTFIAVEQAWQDDGGFVDTTAAFNGAPDINIFVNNGAVCYWGMASPFNQIEVVLNTVASGPGIKPVFEFSDGVGGWTVFPPIDDTMGFRQAGLISWVIATLLAAGWAQDTVNAVANKFWFRITRTQVALTTPPNEETLRVAASIEYRWDEDGIVTIAGLGVNVVIPAAEIDARSAANPQIRINETVDTASYVFIEDTSAIQMRLVKISSAGNATMDMEPRPLDGTGAATFRFFRNTNTTGTTYFQVFLGDGTNTSNAIIRGQGGNSYVCANNGNFGVGIVNAIGKAHADQSDPAANIPVLSLDQADLSEEFIDFIAAVGAGNPIDTAAVGTYYGKARVAVNGTFKFVALYNS